MTNVIKIISGKEPYDEATKWMSKLDRGLSEKEERELRDWLAQSAKNRNELQEVSQLWDKMNSLSWLSEISSVKRAKTASFRWAAAILTAITIAAVVQILKREITPEVLVAKGVPSDKSIMIYETAIGEQSNILLADGSEIVLNTNSELHVRLAKHQRILMLTRGEVHVDVTPDSNRPLSVVVADKIIQAVGTAFSVEVDGRDNIELLVTEGVVLVGSRSEITSDISEKLTLTLPESSTTVKEGQELQLNEPGAQTQLLSLADMEARLSWREGNLIFQGETLEEALQEVSRYTTIEFVFLSDAIKNDPVAGRVKAGDVDGLLGVLRENFGVAYERTDDSRVLLSSLRL